MSDPAKAVRRVTAIPLPADVLSRSRRDLPGWRERLPARGPRLFFDDASWRALPGRVAAATGRARRYFDDACRAGREVARAPTPVYRDTDEMMRLTGLHRFEASQELWQRVVGNHLVVLTFALALQDDAAVRSTLHDTVLAVCDYPQWGGTLSKPNQDLAAGHIARGIAVALDWHPGLWSVTERARVLETTRVRVEALKAAAYGENYWAGRFDENHNHVSVAGLGLCGLAFLDELPEAAEWTALALDNFEQVARTMNADGSSDEGVPYWSYGMSYILQYIEGTRHVLGTHRLYDAPTFRHSIGTRLHAATPDLSAAMQWGDAPPRDYYGPHHILYRLAAEYRDGHGQYFAARLPFEPGDRDGQEDIVWTALWFDPTLEQVRPTVLDHLAPDAGIVCSRSGWGEDDYLFCFKAGFTNRNHSHLDAGAIAFCVGSDWLLRTPGYGRGKDRPDFWDKAGGRWAFFSNATESHCTLLVNGRNQRFAPDARGVIDGYVSTADWLRTSADLTNAYEDVTRVRREVLHRRGEYVLIVDEVVTPDGARVEWLAQVPPDAEASGDRIRIAGRRGRLEVRSLLPAETRFAVRRPASERVDVDADALRTYTTAQTGRVVRFVTMLIPQPAAGPSRVPHVVGRTEAGRQEYEITRAGRRDVVVIDPDATPAIYFRSPAL